MSNMINAIKQFLARLAGQQPDSYYGPQDTELVKKLMMMLTMTRENEDACDDVYEVLDLYAEAVARGEDVSQVMPLVEHHLLICGNCREEYEALLAMVQLEAAV